MKLSQIITTLFIAGSAFALSEEEILDKCYDELEIYNECYVTYEEVSEEHLKKICETFRSKKCRDYYKDPLKYVPTCTKTSRSISHLNHMDEWEAEFEEKCKEDPNQKIVDKCYKELKEYDECYVDYDISGSKLEKECAIYKSKKCTDYFKNPIKYVPSCSEAIKYRSISKLNDIDTWTSDFNKECKDVITPSDSSSNNSTNNQANVPANNQTNVPANNQTTILGNNQANNQANNQTSVPIDTSNASTITSTTVVFMLLSLLFMMMN